MLSLICAVARNGVIGRAGELPWHLPADLAHFKRVTWGKPIAMGRRTHESIGRALPGRRNIVVTRRRSYRPEGCETAPGLDAARALCEGKDELIVIGGAMLYAEALPHASRIYLTRVRAEVEGDVRFPDFDPDEWVEVERADHPRDERHAHAFSIAMLERRHEPVR